MYKQLTEINKRQGINRSEHYLTHYVMRFPIDDYIGVYEFTNSRGKTYRLEFPYVRMMHPTTVIKLLEFIDRLWECYNIKVILSSTIRSIEESIRIIYDPSNVYSGNPPLISPHNFGLQVDINPYLVIYKNNKEYTLKIYATPDNQKKYGILQIENEKLSWEETEKVFNTVWTIVAEEQNKKGLRSGVDFTSVDRVHYDHPLSYDLQSLFNNWYVNQCLRNISQTRKCMEINEKGVVSSINVHCIYNNLTYITQNFSSIWNGFIPLDIIDFQNKQIINADLKDNFIPSKTPHRIPQEQFNFWWLENKRPYCSSSNTSTQSTSNSTSTSNTTTTSNTTSTSNSTTTSNSTSTFVQDTTITINISTNASTKWTSINTNFTSINTFTRLVSSIDKT